MLLQFAVENYLSFRDRAVLSMLADPRVEHDPGQVLEGPGGKKVLRAAAVYGANGSGKSNLVKALGALQKMVVQGTRSDDRLSVIRFKLDPALRQVPAHFELELVADGEHYSYGFEATSKQITAEWLSKVSSDGNEQMLFEREAGNEGLGITLGETISTDPRRRGFLEYVAQGTRQNQLFLAEAGERNVTELDPVRSTIANWTIVEPESFYLPLFAQIEEHDDFRHLMGSVLKQAGTGVDEVRVRVEPADKHPAAADLAQMLEKTKAPDLMSLLGARPGVLRLNDEGRPEIVRIVGIHHVAGDGEVELDLQEESDGTRRLLELAPILHMLDERGPDALFAIDEMERSLHPLLTRMLLQLFFARTGAGAAAQLIFTTHDTNLLDRRILSRDSIWLMEKDVRGGSVLYPLSDLDLTQLDDLEKQGKGLEKAYLQGRFGAIPFFGSLEGLGLRKEDLK